MLSTTIYGKPTTIIIYQNYYDKIPSSKWKVVKVDGNMIEMDEFTHCICEPTIYGEINDSTHMRMHNRPWKYKLKLDYNVRY